MKSLSHWRATLATVAVGLVTVVLAVGWPGRKINVLGLFTTPKLGYRIESFSPHLYRIGVIVVLSGLLWWVAECFGVAVMRVMALIAGLGLVLALINVGDDNRINAESVEYLALRESVGSELANVLPIGDPPAPSALVNLPEEPEEAVEAETAEQERDPGDDALLDEGAEAPAASQTVEDQSSETEQQDSREGETKGLIATEPEQLETGPDAPEGTETSVRARDFGQTVAAAGALNLSVRPADIEAAACPAVRVRLGGGALGPFVTLEQPPISVTADNIIAATQGASDSVLSGGALDRDDLRDVDRAIAEWRTTTRRRDLAAFLSLLDAVGLSSTLTGEGSFTVFVPPAAAVEKLIRDWVADPSSVVPGQLADRRALVELVGHHIVREQIAGAELLQFAGTSVLTVVDDHLRVSTAGSGLTVDNQTVIDLDVVTASNGTIHRVSGLLEPERDLMVVLGEPAMFEDLVNGLEETGLAHDLDGQSQFTIFAPTNAAVKIWGEAQALAGADGRELLEQLIIASPLSFDDLAASIDSGVESIHGTTLHLTNEGTVTEPNLKVEGAAISVTSLESTTGLIYEVDEMFAQLAARDCEPRTASALVLNLLRGELIGASTRTSNASTQQQLGDRLAEVEAQIAGMQENVAVHRLVIEGADTLVGDSIGFTVNDDVAARLGGWGWVVVAIGAVIGYRRLEIINGRREPGPIRLEPGDTSGMNEQAKADAHRAAVVIGNRLGQAELREPATIPGGDTSRQVAEVLQAEGMPGGAAAQAIVRFLQNTAFPEKGAIVAATVEWLPTAGNGPATTGSGPAAAEEGPARAENGNVRVTARVTEARSGRLLYSQPFVARSVDEAAEQAAAYVAVRTLADSRTTPPWAAWPEDDGTGLRAYQQVALDQRTREARLDPFERRDRLETAVAACPYSGLARVALGQQVQVVGPLPRRGDADPDVAVDYEKEKHAIGRSLVSGVPHFAWATTEYPNFLIARYRLAATLSMLAEDVDNLWLFERDDHAPPETKDGGAFAHLSAAGLSDEIADLLSRPARHRRPWWGMSRQASGGNVRKASVRVQAVSRWLSRTAANLVPFTGNTQARLNEDQAKELRTDPIHLKMPAKTPAKRPDDKNVNPEGTTSPVHVRTPPKPTTLLDLATNEVKSGRWALTWYPWLRSWRQAERSYWLNLALHPSRRRREQAAFRILGEIIELRKKTLDEPPIAIRMLQAQRSRVLRLQEEHRDDAVTCYAAAAFHGLAFDRLWSHAVQGFGGAGQEAGARADAVEGPKGDGQKADADAVEGLGRRRGRGPMRSRVRRGGTQEDYAGDLAHTAIRLVREARDASNGFLISTYWVQRDPDLRVLREEASAEWQRLIRRLRTLEGHLTRL